MANAKAAELDALHGPYPKKILASAIPIILTGLFQRLYNTADMLVVGRFAEHAETTE